MRSLTESQVGLFILLVVYLTSCETVEKQSSSRQFSIHELGFINGITESPERCLYQYDYFYNGGGVAIGDLTNDGLPDIYLTGNDVPDKLLINVGDLEFEEQVLPHPKKNESSWHTGVTLVDINRDGWLDIYVCASGPDWQHSSTRNLLYLNQQDGTFIEEAAAYGLDEVGLSTQAVFFDMDGDDDLDVFVLNHGVRNLANQPFSWLKAMKLMKDDLMRRSSSQLYRNDDGAFVNVTQSSGLVGPDFGLGVSVADFDGDGDPDIYVANDFFLPDRMYINNGSGQFADQADSHLSHSSFFSMGSDVADINNDNLPDLVVLDMTPADHYRSKTNMNSMNVNEFRYLTDELGYLPQYMVNSLQLNRGAGLMSEIAQFSGVSSTDWSWAPLLADFDNDGLRDLYITNGYWRDVKNNDWRMAGLENPSTQSYFDRLQTAPKTPLANYMYANQNGLQFSDSTQNWGLGATSFSNGAAYGDLDADGDLDLVVNNLGQASWLLENHSLQRKDHHWLQFNFVEDGVTQTSGYRVEIELEGQTLSGDLETSRGYQSSVEPLIHFGLGATIQVKQISIYNSRGEKFAFETVEVDQRIHVDVKQLKPAAHADGDPEKRLFVDATRQGFRPLFLHVEDDYDDFAIETLLPHRQSNLGPALATGDWNGDGLEDVFVGGGPGQSAELYVQQATGTFLAKENLLTQYKKGEDIGATFCDFNGDDIQDIYVATTTRDYLLEFDKHGNPHRVDMPVNTCTQALALCDWDSDGDQDLFVAGRTTTGSYPLAPRSYLLQNSNGKLTDVTNKLCPALQNVGMITDALWMDWDGDERSDLVVVGEWMAPTVFLQHGDDFEPTSIFPGENQIEGWYYSVQSADVDNDGNDDLILGNIGLNNKFHPTFDKPLHVFANDFDGNGSLDIVLSKHYQDKMVPVRGRECSSGQMPFIADKFPSFNEFASASLQDIYPQELLDSALHLEVTQFQSYVVLRKSTGPEVIALPPQAQWSAIRAMVVQDFNGDGNLDILVAGNIQGTEVETVPYDAGRGNLLLGNGDGTFEDAGNILHTGLILSGDVVNLLPVALSDDKIPGIVVARNNGRLGLLLSRE
jgi:enediyne biosynthesis protein E4